MYARRGIKKCRMVATEGVPNAQPHCNVGLQLFMACEIAIS
jgi:hypothetical protein